MTSMSMGTRGFVVDIEGMIRVTGANYAAAYTNMVTAVENIESLQFFGTADYTYGAVTLNTCIFHNFRLLRMPGGKQFGYTQEGYLVARFSIQLIGHV